MVSHFLCNFNQIALTLYLTTFVSSLPEVLFIALVLLFKKVAVLHVHNANILTNYVTLLQLTCSMKRELGGLVAVVASWLSGYDGYRHPGFESRSYRFFSFHLSL